MLSFPRLLGVSLPEKQGKSQKEKTRMANRFLSSKGVGKSCVLPIRAPNPSPTLDKNLASMGPGILSSVGFWVWRKAPDAFPDSNTTLDTYQSAKGNPKNGERGIREEVYDDRAIRGFANTIAITTSIVRSGALKSWSAQH